MSDNLYQTPNSNIPPAPDSSSEPRKVATANGWRWLVDAKGYFLASPGIWFGSMLVVGLILMIVALIPVINLLVNLATPVFSAGFMFACDQLRQKKPFKLEHVFEGFNQNFAQLLIVGLIYMGCIIVIFTIIALVMGVLGFASIDFNNPKALEGLNIDQMINLFILPMLFGMAILIPVIMAYWFAPALVMLRKKSAIDAMRLSFKACTINIVPFLVYGLGGLAIMLVFMLLASLFVSISIVIAVPLIAIGYLAFIAIIVASTYTSFNDIFPSVENEELEPMPQDPDQMIA